MLKILKIHNLFDLYLKLHLNCETEVLIKLVEVQDLKNHTNFLLVP